MILHNLKFIAFCEMCDNYILAHAGDVSDTKLLLTTAGWTVIGDSHYCPACEIPEWEASLLPHHYD